MCVCVTASVVKRSWQPFREIGRDCFNVADLNNLFGIFRIGGVECNFDRSVGLRRHNVDPGRVVDLGRSVAL